MLTDVTFSAVLIGAALLLALAFVAAANTWVEVNESRFVPAQAARLHEPLRTLLVSVPNGDVIDTGHDSLTLTVRRRPGWLILVILLTLPVGLLLLSLKNTGVLMVTLVPVDGGTEVRMVGRTHRDVPALLDRALAPLEVSVR